MSELLSKIQGIAEGKDLSALGSSIKFVVDEEIVLIDPEAGTITSDDNDASCTVTVDGETMEEILNGSTSSQAAFMTGKLKVAGDMGVALKVGTILS
jgi:putative sterol carrier protein